MTKRPKRDYVEMKLGILLKMFHERPKDDPTKASGTSSIAEDIARSYRYLGDYGEATHYFKLAASHCLTALEHLPIEDLRPDQAGHHFFHCARKTWYAGRREAARELFLAAVDEYQHGYEHEIEGVRVRCRLYTVFCLVFLGDYERAIKHAGTAMELQKASEIPHPGTATSTLKEIAELLAVGNHGAMQSALNRAKEYMSREKITEYGARPHPIVDVKDYILSLLGENGEEAEGPEHAG